MWQRGGTGFALVMPPPLEHLQAVYWAQKEGEVGERRGAVRKEKQWFLFMSWCLSLQEDGFIALISLFCLS